MFSSVIVLFHRITFKTIIVFVWSRNGANMTKAFVKGLLAPEFNLPEQAGFYVTAQLKTLRAEECQLDWTGVLKESWRQNSILWQNQFADAPIAYKTSVNVM